jgi:hypothetical protein
MNTLAPSQRTNRINRSATPTRRPQADWLQKLAAWADRQPRHRRLGSWTQV